MYREKQTIDILMQKLLIILIVASFAYSFSAMSGRKAPKADRKSPIPKVELSAENWIERSEEMARTRYGVSCDMNEKCNLYNY